MSTVIINQCCQKEGSEWFGVIFNTSIKLWILKRKISEYNYAVTMKHFWACFAVFLSLSTDQIFTYI